jgi:N4-gp56 family major capsid protein
MAQQTWTYDAPTGVYKSHAMSEDLRMAAIAQTKILQFCRPEEGYGRKKGDAITISRVSNIEEPDDARVLEADDIPQDEISLSTVSITVSEWGRAVPFTSLSEDLSSFNMENIVQKQLLRQMRLSMDNSSAAAFKETLIKAVPTGVSALTISTNGVAGGTAVSNVNYYHMEAIRDYMYSDLLVPGYEGDDYIGLFSTQACRGLKNDPKFEEWKKYTTPEVKATSEIGKIENIRIIEINNQNALTQDLGTGSVLGEGLIFGEDAVAMAVVLDPELRAAIPRDFGRKKSVAWYGILEFGLIWDTANAGEARVVHITSL